MSEPNFWNDKKQSESIINELNNLKKILEDVENLKIKITSNLELVDILKQEEDLEIKEMLELESSEIENKLNDLKTARGAKTIHTNLSQQDLLETIWLERRKELWGEGFSLIDIIRNQQTVVRNAYPEGPIDYIYTDENGQTHTLKKKTQGHRFFNFPDKSAFCPNSKYYLYRITDSEELANKNLYKDHPKLSIYTK